MKKATRSVLLDREFSSSFQAPSDRYSYELTKFLLQLDYQEWVISNSPEHVKVFNKKLLEASSPVASQFRQVYPDYRPAYACGFYLYFNFFEQLFSNFYFLQRLSGQRVFHILCPNDLHVLSTLTFYYSRHAQLLCNAILSFFKEELKNPDLDSSEKEFYSTILRSFVDPLFANNSPKFSASPSAYDLRSDPKDFSAPFFLALFCTILAICTKSYNNGIRHDPIHLRTNFNVASDHCCLKKAYPSSRFSPVYRSYFYPMLTDYYRGLSTIVQFRPSPAFGMETYFLSTFGVNPPFSKDVFICKDCYNRYGSVCPSPNLFEYNFIDECLTKCYNVFVKSVPIFQKIQKFISSVESEIFSNTKKRLVF